MTTIMQFHSKAKLLPADSIFPPTAMRDLSNFSEFDVEYDGFVYRTVEHLKTEKASKKALTI